MRILFVSDLHANPWALDAVLRDASHFDHVVCAGDAANYGPDPAGLLRRLRALDPLAVRGNHDQAVAFGTDPQASPTKQPLALAMRDWTQQQLDPHDLAWLRRRPLRLAWEVAGTRFTVLHATPRDELYDYRLNPQASDEFVRRAVEGVEAGVLVVGHTHYPLLRRVGKLRIVNPGSVGQPLDGDPRAAYAVWHDGEVELRRAAYDPAEAVAALARVPLPPAMRAALARTLQTGELA
jgi:putative phosphoesterase